MWTRKAPLTHSEAAMARAPQDPGRRATLQISTSQRPAFKHPLEVHVFDGRGKLVGVAEVRDGKVELPLLPDGSDRARLFITPVDPSGEQRKLSVAQLERLRAYEPVLQADPSATRIDIPGIL